LEFVHEVMAENKRIEVNWATYANIVDKRQQAFESAKNVRQENLVRLQGAQVYGVPSFGLLGNCTTTSLSK
jgi:hypothetical protein